MGTSVYRVAMLVLLTALCKGDLPEDDFRIVNTKDLLSEDSDVYEDNSTSSFSQLLFDVARDQVLVGARDVLLRLSLRGLRPIERSDWPAPPDKTKLCQDKGQTEEDCHNYIKVLLSYGHKLFACGTNAFSPICSWREIESINTVTSTVSGVASCPHNPHSNVTAILSSSGEYYAGTPTDFASSDMAICRSRGASPRNTDTLRSNQYDLNWLNEPQFVGSFEDDTFIYIVFREVAVEFMNCGKTIYSRIARVCKNDSGGSLVMRNNWSTFLKARLTCEVPGSVPFYYDEIQSMEYLAQEGLLIAVFTTNDNSIPGSAVCIYNMSAIHKVFDGPYKIQDTPTSTWEPRTPTNHTKRHFMCEGDSRPQIEYHRYHLMYDSIRPISQKPIYKATLERFTHVTVDVTHTKMLEKQLVIYVATVDSEVLKLTAVRGLTDACLSERWKLGNGKKVVVKTMQFVKETMSIYIGSETSVLRIGAEHCSRHATRSSCVNAVDPYCGWHNARELCVKAVNHLSEPEFVQVTDRCPSGHTPVDGGWTSWSDWEPCMQENTHSYTDDGPDMCQCRHRSCDNPKPANGGLKCIGSAISVCNCTVHGGWSVWSSWGECSSSCGIAVKSRRRSCSSPEPRHGGRPCVGVDTEDMYCTNLPPCADPDVVDGGWSNWGPWSSCSMGSPGGPSCGLSAGGKERKRICNNPTPRNGGLDCEGSKVERAPCDLKPCEVKKATAWTPWVQIPSNISDGSYTEKRFKFLCKAPSPEQLRLSLSREEERYCSHGSCSSVPPSDVSWGLWSEWGPCSVACGGGQQWRSRACLRQGCLGPSKESRECNVGVCEGQLSCWSDWSACSGGCGSTTVGRSTRTRACLAGSGHSCVAASVQTRPCLASCADSEIGWGEWGAWSECTNGEKLRKRSCEKGACIGPQVQVAGCDDGLDNELYAMPAYTQNIEMASFVTSGRSDSLGTGGLVGIVVAAFAMGCLLCLGTVIFCQRRGRLPWRNNHRVPSSPHYITAKQNSYVTVPLKDVPRKAKRQPSFSGIGSTSGILLSKSNNISNPNNQNNTMTTPKLYPKAIANEYDTMGTLRRYSNQPKNNLELEEDKFY